MAAFVKPEEMSFLCAAGGASGLSRRGQSSVGSLGLPPLVRNLTSELLGETAGRQLLSVYLRVRPVLPDDDQTQGNPIEVSSNTHVLMHAPKDSVSYKSATTGIGKVSHRFGFTRIFDAETTQSDLFRHTMLSHIEQLVGGLNCLLFTYGTTNSGKTFTVYGPPKHAGSDPGLLPRTLDTLFNSISSRLYRRLDIQPRCFSDVCRVTPMQEQEAFNVKFAVLRAARQRDADPTSTRGSTANGSQDSLFRSMESLDDLKLTEMENRVRETAVVSLDSQPNTKFAVWISFVEIYNESIYDLLAPVPSSSKRRKQLSLGQDKKGNSYLKGVSEVEVRSADEACLVLSAGQKNLRFAATKLNHNSSRSHCVVTVKLIRLLDSSTDPRFGRCSMLTICDLAGSERVEKTHAEGLRMKEAGNINTSLMVLGRCLKALRQHQQQTRAAVAAVDTAGDAAVIAPLAAAPMVPYRDSKLTRVFQAFLAGVQSTRVTMFVNVGPDPRVFDETLQALKFSALAKHVCVQAEPKRRERSRFSIMARQSMRGGGALPRPAMDGIVEDEQGDDEEYQQSLLVLLERMRNELVEEKRKNITQETQLRKELADEFQEYLKTTEQFWKDKMTETELHTQKCAEKQMDEYVKSLNLAGSKGSEDIEELTERAELAEERAEVAENRACRLEQQLEAVNEAHLHLVRVSTEERQTTQQLRADLETTRADTLRVRKELREAEARFKELLPASNETIIAALTKELNELKESVLLKDMDIRETEDYLREGGEEVVKLETENDSLRAQNKRLQASLAELSETVRDTLAQKDDLVQICEARSERVAELEMQLAETTKTTEVMDKAAELEFVASTPTPIRTRNACKMTPCGGQALMSSLPEDLNSTGLFEKTERQVFADEQLNMIQELRVELTAERDRGAARCGQLEAELQQTRAALQLAQQQAADAGEQQQSDAALEVHQLQAELKKLLQNRHGDQLSGEAAACIQQQLEESRQLVADLRRRLDEAGARQLQQESEVRVLEAQISASERERDAFDIIRREHDVKKTQLREMEDQLVELRVQCERVAADRDQAVQQREQFEDRICKLEINKCQLTKKVKELEEDLVKVRESQSQQLLKYEHNTRRLNDDLTRERQERSRIHQAMGRLTPQPTAPAVSMSELDRLRAEGRRKDEQMESMRVRLESLTAEAAGDASSCIKAAASNGHHNTDPATPHHSSVQFNLEDSDDDADVFVTPCVVSGRSKARTSTRKQSRRGQSTPADTANNNQNNGKKSTTRRRPRKTPAKVSNSQELSAQSSDFESDAQQPQSLPNMAPSISLSAVEIEDATVASAAGGKSARKRHLFDKRISHDLLEFSPTEEPKKRSSPRRIVTRQLRSTTYRKRSK